VPRGWSPDALPITPLDGKTWTVAEAEKVLDLNERQALALRNGIKYTHVFPVGRRRSTTPCRPPGDRTYSSKGGRQGRYAKVYRAEELIELVELLGLNGPKYINDGRGPAAARPSTRPRRAIATPPVTSPEPT
jgi:hypothetical protein